MSAVFFYDQKKKNQNQEVLPENKTTEPGLIL